MIQQTKTNSYGFYQVFNEWFAHMILTVQICPSDAFNRF